MDRSIPSPARSPNRALAEVEDMVLRLMELRQAEQFRERRADYQAAIDRLDALAHRLRTAATPGRVVGLPKTASTKPELNKPPPPQAALSLGPVIVHARKPRR